MNETFTLSKVALVKLLTTAYPNPDDPNPHPHRGPFGPHGPGGPISRLEEVALNPQPLPPLTGGRFGSHFRSPQPEPWVGGLIAAQMIERTVFQLQIAEVMVGQDGFERAQKGVLSSMLQEIDDFCGTVPHRLPWWWRWVFPVPPPPDPEHPDPIIPLEINPATLLMAGIEFSRAAETTREGELQSTLSQAADQLFKVGLDRLQSR